MQERTVSVTPDQGPLPPDQPPSVPAPASGPSPATTTPPRPRSPLRELLLILGALFLVGTGTALALYFAVWASVGKVNFPRGLRGVVNPDKLDDAFVDADGDLVADPPKDPAKRLDPEVLHFGVLDRVDRARVVWKEFAEHLAKKTGKKVEIIEAPAGGKVVVEQLRSGKVHIAALSTGTVPVAVNQAGFVPCCVMADDRGRFGYQMEILVAADSKIRSLADLRGQTITLTSMSSLSSFHAPLVVLWEKEKMLPGRDYSYHISRGQPDSIKGLCEGEFQVAAVANDLLRRVVAREKLDEKAYRSIYQSDTFPPACFGYVYSLEPELARKVRDAFLAFDWKGTGLEKAYRPANQTRFVAVTYKKDWESVRAVDRALLDLASQNP
jgi:phosphonate transport system substrate-binding protein